MCFTALAQEEKVLQELDQRANFYGAIAKEIWSNPELGYLEIKSSALLQKTLADAGVAAKMLTLNAMDIINDPSVTRKAQEELNRRRGKDFKYEALTGDREPPLDYRKK